jgi:pullulanase/glycogen debranching enzyme
MKRLTIFALLFIIFATFSKGTTLPRNTQPETPFELRKQTIEEKSKELDVFFSTKKLGSFVENGQTFFRLFAPQAIKVTLCTFNQPEDVTGKEYQMTKDSDGVWEIALWGEMYGIYYGYKVYHHEDNINADKVICLDPYAKAVTTFNTYFNPRRAIVVKEGNYDWQGDKWIQRDWRDLTIYEMHLRDMTAHPSAKAKRPGTYQGLIEQGITGGLPYVKSLGVNTVELLPSMEFANIELPYKDSIQGRYNTWNPYERNHWGYMTAAFFAPEANYAEKEKNLQLNVWEGKSGEAITAFKDMVKAFHKEGIGVIMDVVYNHLSEYEQGNLKEIDKEYYFRLNPDGSFKAESGCGNDLKTERPMLRRLIKESILYWMTEYHVDGFRFDLGKLLDWTTIEEILKEAQKINPHVVFVCEPWGGGYDPAGFSVRGWGSWNDQIRNGVKGENPYDGLGWIFGKWYGNNSLQRIESYVNGTLDRDKFGIFKKKEHSVNYLESHDGLTLGDFIRIGTKEVDPMNRISNVDEAVKLTARQTKLNKLGALFLFTSQGITMIHSGQEFARTKVIPININAPDTMKGRIDRDTYDKDNETNYINFKHAKINKELLDYYKGLIKFRSTFEAFRRADYDSVKFFAADGNDFAFGYTVTYKKDMFLVLFNAQPEKAQSFTLPSGNWDVLIDGEKAGIKPLKKEANTVTLPASSGMVLKKH